MRLAVAVGGRPDVIKVAPLIPVLVRAGFDVDLIFTGPAEVARPAGDEPAFYGVDVPAPAWVMQTDTNVTPTAGAVMAWTEDLFGRTHPDAVLVVGDSATALASAIAAARAGIAVVHLEAGLRSSDLEDLDEIDRVVISRVAALHLTPTEQALENLEDEGIEPERIHFVGACTAEAALHALQRAHGVTSESLVGLAPKRYLVASFRRVENLRDKLRMSEILGGLAASSLPAVMPDAGVFVRAAERFGLSLPASARLVEMQPYTAMLALMRDACAVVADCGEMADEACITEVPCITVRPRTERTATLEAGANRLVEADAGLIASALSEAIGLRQKWRLPKRWDRAVSDRVCRALRRGVVPLS